MTRYWVGGGSSNNWNATGNTNWGTASGTRDNASVPTSSDDVIFDSGDATNCVITSGSVCKSITFAGGTGYSGTVSGTSDLTVSGNVTLASATTYTYSGLLTINASSIITPNGKTLPGSLTLSASNNTTTFTFAGNLTVTGNFSGQGSSAVNRIWIVSDIIGTSRTITCNGTVDLDNVDFTDITGAGTGTWSGVSIGNAGGNSGITFTSAVTRYWIGNAGGWNDSTKWSDSSGGSGGSSVPLCHDTAIFDANSFDIANRSLQLNMRLVCACDFSATDQVFNYILPQSVYFFGTQTWDSNLKTATGNRTLYFYNRAAANWTCTTNSANNAISYNNIVVSCYGTSLTLLDNLYCLGGYANSSFQLTNGTFNKNGYTLTVSEVILSGTATRTFTEGSGNTILPKSGTIWDAATTTGLTYNKGTGSSTIVINIEADATFIGGGLTYNNFSFAPSYSSILTIVGDNTFNSFTADTTAGASTLKFTAGSNQAVSSLTLTGYSGKILTVNSTSSTNATLSDSSGTNNAYYCAMSDITATGGATWYYDSNSTVSDCPGWTSPITNINVTDSGSGYDAPSIISLLSLADSGAGADSPTVRPGVTITDNGSATDIVSALLATLSIADSGSGTINVVITAILSIADSAAGSELISILKTITINDTATASEATTILGMIAISDTATSSEALSLLVNLALSDTGASSEAISVLGQISLSDFGAGSEVLTILSEIALSDTALGTDAIYWINLIIESDTGYATEGLDILNQISISDSGAGSEVINIITEMIVTDNGNASDLISVLASLIISDSGSGDETINWINLLSLSDSGSASEVLTILSEVAVSDSASASDALQILVTLSVLDTATGNDAIDILSQILISDTGAGTDIINILSSLTISDTGTGTEALTILNELLISDTGSGSDLVSLIVQMAIADSGIGNDLITILAQIPITDSAVGSETLDILNILAITDTAVGSDAINLLIQIALSDNGRAAEAINILSMLTISETAVASELITIFNEFKITDSAVSSEALQILSQLTVSDTATGSETITKIWIVRLIKKGILQVKNNKIVLTTKGQKQLLKSNLDKGVI